MPWFERCDTIEKAYKENCLLFHKNGENPGGRYEWLLQMGRWMDASEFVHKRIEELKVYERLPEYTGESLTFDLEELYNAIIENNESYVLDYIHTGENQTIKNLGFVREFKLKNKIKL